MAFGGWCEFTDPLRCWLNNPFATQEVHSWATFPALSIEYLIVVTSMEVRQQFSLHEQSHFSIYSVASSFCDGNAYLYRELDRAKSYLIIYFQHPEQDLKCNLQVKCSILVTILMRKTARNNWYASYLQWVSIKLSAQFRFTILKSINCPDR